MVRRILFASVGFAPLVVLMHYALDLDLLREAEAKREGFGGIRATGAPLPMCKVEVSPCYESRGDELGCRNPEFHEVPLERPSFRVIAQINPAT